VGPAPRRSYSLEDARAALQAWDPRRHGQVSFGALQGEWLVAAPGLTRLWLEINPDNTPSLRLAQRAGYRLERMGRRALAADRAAASAAIEACRGEADGGCIGGRR
jgi:hypothetical protein